MVMFICETPQEINVRQSMKKKNEIKPFTHLGRMIIDAAYILARDCEKNYNC